MKIDRPVGGGLGGGHFGQPTHQNFSRQDTSEDYGVPPAGQPSTFLAGLQARTGRAAKPEEFVENVPEKRNDLRNIKAEQAAKLLESPVFADSKLFMRGVMLPYQGTDSGVRISGNVEFTLGQLKTALEFKARNDLSQKAEQDPVLANAGHIVMGAIYVIDANSRSLEKAVEDATKGHAFKPALSTHEAQLEALTKLHKQLEELSPSPGVTTPDTAVSWLRHY